MRLMIPLFAMLAVRPEAGSCNGSGAAHPPADDGRIGVAGYPDDLGVRVDGVGVGTPADGLIEPGEVIVAIDGTQLFGPHSFWDLKRLAAGVPGTEVELWVTSATGNRDVTLTRAVFDDDVERRDVPRPAADRIDGAIRAAGGLECIAAGHRTELRANVNVEVQVIEVSGFDQRSMTCLSGITRDLQIPGGYAGGFVWIGDRVDDEEAYSEAEATAAMPYPDFDL